MIGRETRVLVTGGTGFIGSHLVEHLVKLGASVTVIDNLFTGNLNNLQIILPQIELKVGDLGDLLRLKQVQLNKYQYVFHLAANPYIPPSVENPAYDFQANLNNTFMLLEALRQTPHAPRLINISSAAVYGNPACLPIKETDPTVPISPYGVSKLAAERYVFVYSQIYDLWAISLRLFSVYGVRQRKQVIYDFLCKLRENPTQLEILGDGTQTRDFTYVLDVVQAMLLTATRSSGKGEVYNVATGTSYSITQVAEVLCQLCGLTPQLIYTGQIRDGDAQKWSVDISRLKQLGFEVQIRLEKGLELIRDWYDGVNE